MARATFKVYSTTSKVGKIILADGRELPLSRSQKFALDMLQYGVRAGLIDAADMDDVRSSIQASGLPFPMTQEDAQTLVDEYFSNPNSLIRAGIEMKVFLVDEATVASSRSGFDIRMPEARTDRRHPVHLYRSGKMIETGTASNATEARGLVNDWARRYHMDEGMKRNFRTRVVETVARLNYEADLRDRADGPN